MLVSMNEILAQAEAKKCAVGVNGAKGSAMLLREEDMLAIYRAAR